VIGLRIYETLRVQQVAGSTRFTPSTITVLAQDPATKALTPELAYDEALRAIGQELATILHDRVSASSLGSAASASDPTAGATTISFIGREVDPGVPEVAASVSS
jgi:hypothetical protein